MSAVFDSRPDTYEHIGKVRGYVLAAVGNLLGRADRHDASKLVDPEREAFDRMTPKLAGLVYGTDEYKASLAELGPALAHHYAANSHHPEHYEDGIRGMSLVDLIEMLCDWKAATERTANGDLTKSIAFNQGRWWGRLPRPPPYGLDICAQAAREATSAVRADLYPRWPTGEKCARS